ncbi:MAG: carbohydrate kinase [Solobacterium sp.]|jgi:fructokinase|nr:carbohydrate kinase [Solobacterium sp.]
MTEKKYDVIALGELLIDFTDSGLSPQGNPLLEANPGGAPCNVLSMLQRLGKKTAFVGKVGEDQFGRNLADAIKEQGIDASHLKMDPEIHTTLAIVLKKPDGDRDFAFYRKPGADIMLTEDEIDPDFIKEAKIFHFGSLSLTDEPVRSATKKAIAAAKEAGALISFDPNLREPLWETLDHAKEQIDWGMKQSDILKISDNEIIWFTGKEDFDEGIEALKAAYPNLKFIALSMGPDGSRIYLDGKRVEKAAYLQEGTIETTGAGDTFCANMLSGILDYGLDMDEETMMKVLKQANAAASLVTTKKGALRVMPTLDEVNAFIASRE